MGCCFCWSKTDRNKIIVSFVFVYQFYLNGFESFSDQLIILTGELLKIGIVELRVGIALGTNVPENILLIKKSSRGNKPVSILTPQYSLPQLAGPQCTFHETSPRNSHSQCKT